MSSRDIREWQRTESLQPQDIIEGILQAASMTMLHGPSPSFKSFLAIDWALCIATGTPWQGHPVKQQPVVFFKGEGHSGFAARVLAWEIANGINIDNAPFYASEMATQVLDGESAAWMGAEVQNLRLEHGKPVAIFIDTLARNFGPGDENLRVDVLRFAKCLEEIAGQDSLRVILHDTGWKTVYRPRGSRALPEMMKAVYRILPIDMEGYAARLTQTKMQGRPVWKDDMALTLDQVQIGQDEYNDPWTSLAITDFSPFGR